MPPIGTTDKRIVDINNSKPPLWAYVLATAAGTSTLAGIFLDINGRQVGVSRTGSITTTPQTIKTILTEVPPGAVGFRGRCSAAFSIGLFGKEDGTFPAGLSTDMSGAPAQYPQQAISTDFSLGRV